MGRKSAPLFHEEQSFRQPKARFLVAILPAAFLLVLVWQLITKRPVGGRPLSNSSLAGWTIFLWLVYLRLVTLKLVTEVKDRKLSLSVGGLWSVRRIPMDEIRSFQAVSYDADADYGGYGIRLSRKGRAYIANGNRGVSLTLAKGTKVLVGTQRGEELVRVIASSSTGR